MSFRKIFVCGFPGLYGGASTELHHQILVWIKMAVQVHLIPSSHGYENEPLYNEMVELGVHVHIENDFSAIEPCDPVIGFCNSEFLNSLESIKRQTRRIVFVNCMTWIFPMEREAMSKGLIKMFLYQNEDIRLRHQSELRPLNADPAVKFLTFKPYFSSEHFPFIMERSDDFTGCGRISRQDADKFAKNTLHIYEYFVSPKWKQGLFLGFDSRSESKIGPVYDWIRTASDHTVVSQQEFYAHCEFLLQPSDTTENWPRIGFEAMASGSVLIVDNRGGWQRLVDHGKTGWLCNNERDFIYYASKMAYEPNMRLDLANSAREKAMALGSFAVSIESWENIFDEIDKLPD